MKFSATFLLLLGFAAITLADDSLDKVPSVVKCGSECPDKNESACKKGCKFAYALTFAPKEYTHNPSCQEACNEKYSDESERSACHNGCEHFKNEGARLSLNSDPGNSLITQLFNHCHRRAQQISEYMNHIFNGAVSNQDDSNSVEFTNDGESFFDRKMSEMMQRMRGFFSGSAPTETNSDEPVITSRVRIFFFAKPENNVEEPKILTAKHAESSKTINGPVVSAGRYGSCRKFLNHVFTNPFNLLLALTMFVLVILFITQLVLFMRRRPRRSPSNQFTRLPTYAEAMEIKIPINTDDDVFKPTEKSNPPPPMGNDAQA